MRKEHNNNWMRGIGFGNSGGGAHAGSPPNNKIYYSQNNKGAIVKTQNGKQSVLYWQDVERLIFQKFNFQAIPAFNVNACKNYYDTIIIRKAKM